MWLWDFLYKIVIIVYVMWDLLNRNNWNVVFILLRNRWIGNNLFVKVVFK